MAPKRYPSRTPGKVWVEKTKKVWVKKTKKLTDLPNDVLKKEIIEKLTPEDILALSKVSTQFRDLTQDIRTKDIEKYKKDYIEALRRNLEDYYGKNYDLNLFFEQYDPRLLDDYQNFLEKNKGRRIGKKLEDEFLLSLGPQELSFMNSYLFDKYEEMLERAIW